MLQSDLSSDWSEPLDFIVENDGLQNGPDSAIDERNHYRGRGDSSENVIEFPMGPLDEEIVESSS